VLTVRPFPSNFKARKNPKIEEADQKIEATSAYGKHWQPLTVSIGNPSRKN